MLKFLRRSRLKPWDWSTRTWIVAILVAFAVSPLISRWICLSQIPDVGLPFNVEDIIGEDVPLEEDAFVKYADIVQKLRQKPFSAWGTPFDPSVENLETNLDPALRQWLIERRDVLAEFQSAGTMLRAGGPSLRISDFNMLLPLHQDMRGLARFSEAEAFLYERDGDLEQAWACHLATMRSGIHAERPGIAICCLVGIANQSMAFEGISKWASDPALSPHQLRSAREQLTKEFAKHLPMSHTEKAEYLLLRNSAHSVEGPNWIIPEPQATGALLEFKRFVLWSLGEPELTLRLQRQILVNNLEELDKPKFQRRLTEDSSRMIFVLNPEVPRKSGQLESGRLTRVADNSFPIFRYRGQPIWAERQMDIARQRGDARETAILVLLAAQEFRRIHGEFPEKLEQLVPVFLDGIPIDPMDGKGTPIRYRREVNGEAIVWSIGQDEVDDGGSIDSKPIKDFGYRIRLKQQTEGADQESSQVSQ